MAAVIRRKSIYFPLTGLLAGAVETLKRVVLTIYLTRYYLPHLRRQQRRGEAQHPSILLMRPGYYGSQHGHHRIRKTLYGIDTIRYDRCHVDWLPRHGTFLIRRIQGENLLLETSIEFAHNGMATLYHHELERHPSPYSRYSLWRGTCYRYERAFPDGEQHIWNLWVAPFRHSDAPVVPYPER